jgi:hypothetical protein
MSLENVNNCTVIESKSVVTRKEWVAGERQEEGESFEMDVLVIFMGVISKGVYVCQNLPNFIHEMHAVDYMSIIH